MESYERDRFHQATEQHTRLSIRGVGLAALVSPLVEFIGYASFVPFLLYANYQLNLSLGVFVLFVASLFRLFEPVRKLSRMHLHFQQAFASSSRVFELLDSPVTIRESSGASELPRLSRSLSFEGLSFSYGGNGNPVLQDIDLRIQKGEIVALVGSSGAGKSTLVSLIPRFYDASSGRVLIDGVDIRTVTLNSLRGQIVIVSQETFLFDDTVANNIAYGRKDCSQNHVEKAAKAALIHDFVLTLPGGYDTMIGERGERLSGGQRQRIAIARAILKDAPFLILDEATSALDTESERLVQAALYNLMRQRTGIVIAHRLSTVRLADRIVVMESGRIVETGDHRTLLERSGRYRELYDLQFAEVEGSD
jgi:subfamily B ATP-binding cassette protein MsbA